jgi:hypothetical protein
MFTAGEGAFLVRVYLKMKFCSNYAKTLSGDDSNEYSNKILLCDNVDPYELHFESLSEDQNTMPSVTREDLVQYLVLSTSSITLKQLKAAKSLEAHSFLTSGWVQQVRSKRLSSERILVAAKVSAPATLCQ